MDKETSHLVYQVLYHYWFYRFLMEAVGEKDNKHIMTGDQFNTHISRIQKLYNAYKHESFPPVHDFNQFPRFGFKE